MKTFVNFFRKGVRESMMHLLCFGGLFIMLGTWAIICFHNWHVEDFGFGCVAVLVTLITGKSYQGHLDTKRDLASKAMDQGAPLKPQPDAP